MASGLLCEPYEVAERNAYQVLEYRIELFGNPWGTTFTGITFCAATVIQQKLRFELRQGSYDHTKIREALLFCIFRP